MRTIPTRRGLLQGASSLALLATTGCPKKPAPPEIAPLALLAGHALTDSAVSAVLFALRTAGFEQATLAVQRRRLFMVTRTLDGPSLVEENLHGMVLRGQRAGSTIEVATSRVNDAGLRALLESLSLPSQPLGEAAGLDDIALVVEGVDRVEPAREPSLSVVGAGLALLVEQLRQEGPTRVEACWESVVDERLYLSLDGRISKRVQRHRRVSLEAELVGAAGIHTVVHHRSLPDRPAEEWASVFDGLATEVLARSATRGQALEPRPQTAKVVLSPAVQAELAYARSRHRGRPLELSERGRVDVPAAGVVGALSVPGDAVVLTAAMVGPCVRVDSLQAPPDILPSGAVVLWLGDAELHDGAVGQPIAAGSSLCIPAAVLRAPAKFLSGEGAKRDGPPSGHLVVGPRGRSMLVRGDVPSRILDGCELEGFHGS